MKFAKIPEASQIAAVKFEEALNSSPLNKGKSHPTPSNFLAVSLRNCASCTYNSILKEFGTAGEIPKCFLDYVFDLLDTALAVDPNDTHTLYQVSLNLKHNNAEFSSQKISLFFFLTFFSMAISCTNSTNTKKQKNIFCWQ